ncbi:Galactosylgalactosylxylosylprotein 3-beta-glucuronosyltransferase [Meloidogyne graminicola]|uniref:Galactosylgalactosylxylosylprotein 3-beta-glucuronosyltransferase n=1 Tax=Meloidogyne graminicola TaxID=189291 RepID=A0A8T0A3B0_9BILA|nr:Galactosylgalactosylxylosylprotein 3-beta-glucuronosyltransferase [Meloidogyne graminicola]
MVQSRQFFNDASTDSGGGDSCSSSGSISPISPPSNHSTNLKYFYQKQQQQNNKRRYSLLNNRMGYSNNLLHNIPFRFPSFIRLLFNSKYFSFLITIILLLAIWRVWIWNIEINNKTTIILITPTYKRPERLADMTRLSQTLMNVPNIHWIVIEDSNQTYPAVERLLKRSSIPYTYFFTTTKPGFPRRGWTHRNVALEYIRKNYANYKKNSVVYFADDDNTYDIRLFNKYIKNVKTIGIWAVAFAGGAKVESPKVNKNGTIIAWNAIYAPTRRFAVDMAGFAINLKLILSGTASFNEGCIKSTPESCFLSQFNIPRDKIEVFGWNEEPKDILVWHTKTLSPRLSGDTNGYIYEDKL